MVCEPCLLIYIGNPKDLSWDPFYLLNTPAWWMADMGSRIAVDVLAKCSSRTGESVLVCTIATTNLWSIPTKSVHGRNFYFKERNAFPILAFPRHCRHIHL